MKDGSATQSRRWLSYAGYTFASLLALLIVAAAVVFTATQYRLRRTHHPVVATVTIPTSPEALAHGRHLATTRGCADCHGADFAGQIVVDDPAIGRIAGSNITTGAGGLGPDFSDDDWVRAIRHGLSPVGRALVLMPSLDYTNLSDEDLGSLIAYLKSIPPVDRARGPVAVGPLARVLMMAGEIKLSAEEIDHAAPRPARVTVGATLEYGRYLSATCIGCHGDNLSGGRIAGAPPDWPEAANLTPHESGRLGGWTEGDFFSALREQRRPDGTVMSPVMPAAFGQLTDEETKALWIYIRSLPAAATGLRTK